MNNYTDGEIQGLLTRLIHCYYFQGRFLQMIKSKKPDGLKMGRGSVLLNIQGIYATSFYINLSELFRHFRKDEEISFRLKTTNDQRIEFRKKVRDVLAKSNDAGEYFKIFHPYIVNCGINWDAEFLRLIDCFRAILTKSKYKAGNTLLEMKLKEIDAFLKSNPINLNYPDIERK